mmetsp:Transcript_110474/g.307769  ORF Transcript_110474/g.307769 Transcript_110474/m.307769 type:complete len:396 (+) Transcript_110474:79-1266(+)
MTRRRPPLASPRPSAKPLNSSVSSTSLPPRHRQASRGMRRGRSLSAPQRRRKPSPPRAQALRSNCSSCCQCSQLSSAHQAAVEAPSSGLLKSSSDTSRCPPNAVSACWLTLLAARSSLSAQPARSSAPASPTVFVRTESARSLRPRSARSRCSQPALVSSHRSRKSSSSSTPPLAMDSANASKPSSPTAQPSRRRRRNVGGPLGFNSLCNKSSKPSAPSLLLSRMSRSSTPEASQRPTAAACASPRAESQRSSSRGAGPSASCSRASPSAPLRESRSVSSLAAPKPPLCTRAAASARPAAAVRPLSSRSRDVNEVFSASPSNRRQARSPNVESPTESSRREEFFRNIRASRLQLASLRLCPLASNSRQQVLTSRPVQISSTSSSAKSERLHTVAL